MCVVVGVDVAAVVAAVAVAVFVAVGFCVVVVALSFEDRRLHLWNLCLKLLGLGLQLRPKLWSLRLYLWVVVFRISSFVWLLCLSFAFSNLSSPPPPTLLSPQRPEGAHLRVRMKN